MAQWHTRATANASGRGFNSHSINFFFNVSHFLVLVTRQGGDEFRHSTRKRSVLTLRFQVPSGPCKMQHKLKNYITLHKIKKYRIEESFLLSYTLVLDNLIIPPPLLYSKSESMKIVKEDNNMNLLTYIHLLLCSGTFLFYRL